jgi:RNA polymerase sigma-70 factor (ECF subfamily)
MVRNLSIDYARRRARERSITELEDEGTQIACPCPCPETTMTRCQALHHVMAALAELSERMGDAFRLHRIEGVSQRDIASRMQVSPTLVNFMVRDAHEHCRARLLSLEADDDGAPAIRPAGRAGKTSRPASGGQIGRAAASERRELP